MQESKVCSTMELCMLCHEMVERLLTFTRVTHFPIPEKDIFVNKKLLIQNSILWLKNTTMT